VVMQTRAMRDMTFLLYRCGGLVRGSCRRRASDGIQSHQMSGREHDQNYKYENYTRQTSLNSMSMKKCVTVLHSKEVLEHEADLISLV
jgi:hypothetical protein